MGSAAAPGKGGVKLYQLPGRIVFGHTLAFCLSSSEDVLSF